MYLVKCSIIDESEKGIPDSILASGSRTLWLSGNDDSGSDINASADEPTLSNGESIFALRWKYVFILL